MSASQSDKAELSDRLRMARELAGLSQSQVAKLLGLHRPSVSEIEAGRRKVSAEELAKLADIYRVSLAWLTGIEDDSDKAGAKLELVARELTKLKSEDLDRVLQVLTMLRSDQEDR